MRTFTIGSVSFLLAAASLFGSGLGFADECASVAHISDAAIEKHGDAVQAALGAVRLPISIVKGRLNGAGGATLLERARTARYVLIGEDHGFVEVPEITRALFGALAPEKFHTLVLEIGSISADWEERSLKANPRSQPRLADEGFGIPFLNLEEEAALVEYAAEVDSEFHMIGVDQEFILSSEMFFRRLVDLAQTGEALRVARDYLGRAIDADHGMVARHDPSTVFLPTLTPADFSTLREAFASPRESEAADIIAALETSAQIYASQNVSGYASNRERSLLMKRNFVTNIAARGDNDARAIFKMGANHAGRGLSSTNQYDLGNLVSEWAESKGAHSFHILVIAAGGNVNRWMPFMATDDMKATAYDGPRELASIGAEALAQNVSPGEWAYYDFASLRSAAQIKKADAKFLNLIFSYDAAVVIGTGHPAHFRSTDTKAANR